MNNCIKLKKFSFFYYHYLYIDAVENKEFQADQIFIKNKLRVYFMKNHYNKKGTNYRIVICKVKKKYEKVFYKSMEELKTKLLIKGYNDYDQTCNNLIKLITGGIKNV